MRRSSFKVSFLLKRQALKKSGNMPIVARITLNSETVQLNTKLDIPESMWSISKGKVKGLTSESKLINSRLDNIRYALTNIFHENSTTGKMLSAEKIKNIFLGINNELVTIIEVFNDHNEGIKKLIDKGTSLSTYKKYELAKRRLEEFMKYRYQVKDMHLKDLNLNFIRDYELFLRSNCQLSNNVAAKMIMFLKKMARISFNNGSIPSNPFAEHKIKMTKTDRGFLTKTELETIMSKRIDIERLDALRDVFLFCCWTGTSYIDVKSMSESNIRYEGDSVWLTFRRQKTKAPVNVLLLDVPIAILNKYRGKLAGGKLLPVLSNQKCNSYLKELADICEIDKNLTFHMRKHTLFFNALTFSMFCNFKPLSLTI